jgi:hypothetical protein
MPTIVVVDVWKRCMGAACMLPAVFNGVSCKDLELFGQITPAHVPSAGAGGL